MTSKRAMKPKKAKGKASSQQSRVPDFKVGDLVGAKVKGFPLWPGRIEKVDIVKNRTKYTVKFFYTNETGYTFIALKPFKDFTDQEKLCNKKFFKDALAMCQVLYDDEQKSQEPEAKSQAANVKSLAEPELQLERESEPEREAKPEAKLKVEPEPDPQPKLELQPEPGLRQEPDEQNRSSVLRKLSEKVEKKKEEKKALKSRRKQRKTCDKACKKVAMINKNILEPFLILSSKFSNGKNYDAKDIRKCKESVRKYQSAIPILDICASYYRRGDDQVFPEYRKCHEILCGIVTNLKSAKKNDRIPSDLKEGLKICLKKTRNSDHVKSFVNSNDFDENRKHAMIERRDNDSD